MTTTRTTQPPRATTDRVAPGLIAVIAGTGAALLVNRMLPAVGPLMTAIVVGLVAGNVPALRRVARPGVEWSTRRLLRAGVVILGLQLALGDALGLGPGVLVSVVVTVAIGFLGTLAIGRLLRVPRGLSILVATGFSICGAAAIAAMEGVVRRRDSDVATAIALVTLYGGLAIAAVPLLGGVLGLAGTDIGAWAGLSVHEVAQVLAAATPAGAAAVALAAVVKLSRVLLLGPLVAVVSIAENRRAGDATESPPLVPLFVVGFVVMVAVRSLGILPSAVVDASAALTTVLLTGALFGLGYGVNLTAIARSGPRALLLGLLSTILVGSVALALVTWLT